MTTATQSSRCSVVGAACTPVHAPLVSTLGSSDALHRLFRHWPKVELHCHLEGALGHRELARLRARGVISISDDDLRKLAAPRMSRDLIAFLDLFTPVVRTMTSPRVVEALTEAVIESAAEQGVVYQEIRFSPYYMAAIHGLDADEVAAAVCASSARAAKRHGVMIRLIVIADRHLGPGHAVRVVELAKRHRSRGIVGFDLAADEANFPPWLFVEAYRQAKQAGLRLTAHAGEAGGPENVDAAVTELGVERVGHGIRAVENTAVVDLVRRQGVTLEVCPTSNIQTGAVRSLEEHPFRRLFDAGVRVTLNTDDPGICAITHTDELVSAARAFRMSLEDMIRLNRTAIDAAFVDDDVTRATLAATVEKQMMTTIAAFVDDLSSDEREALNQAGRTNVMTCVKGMKND